MDKPYMYSALKVRLFPYPFLNPANLDSSFLVIVELRLGPNGG